MKYRALKDFIAFGKAPVRGELVDLTPEQARTLRDERLIVGYETKVQNVPENKAVKKPLRSVRPGRVSRKKTAKRSRKTATK